MQFWIVFGFYLFQNFKFLEIFKKFRKFLKFLKILKFLKFLKFLRIWNFFQIFWIFSKFLIFFKILYLPLFFSQALLVWSLEFPSHAMPVQQHCLGWSLQSRPIGRCNLWNSPVMPVRQHCLGWSLQSRPIGRCNLRNSPVMPVRQHCLGWCGLQSGRCSTAWAEVFNPGRWMFGDTTNAYCACALLEFSVFNSGRACALYSTVGKKCLKKRKRKETPFLDCCSNK